MESNGLKLLSWDFSCLSTPIDHHTDDIDHHTVSYAFFLQRQLESQMMPGYTITPNI